MTWTLEASVTTSDTAGCEAAWEYLFDTYLPAHGWSTGADPNGSSLERVFNWTASENWQYPSGTSSTQYFYAKRSSTNAAWSIYEDATYTTTPGDLATDTTNVVGYDWLNDPTAKARFWQSSDAANATLVTCGKHIVWWHSGFDDWGGYIDGSWDGSADGLTTHIFPLTTGQWKYVNLPAGNTGTSSSEYNLIPNGGGGQYRYLANTPAREHCYVQNFAVKTTSYVVNMFYVTQADTLLFLTSGVSSDSIVGTASSGGSLVLSGGNYYLHTSHTIEGNAIAFDMGTSEPDLT